MGNGHHSEHNIYAPAFLTGLEMNMFKNEYKQSKLYKELMKEKQFTKQNLIELTKNKEVHIRYRNGDIRTVYDNDIKRDGITVEITIKKDYKDNLKSIHIDTIDIVKVWIPEEIIWERDESTKSDNLDFIKEEYKVGDEVEIIGNNLRLKDHNLKIGDRAIIDRLWGGDMYDYILKRNDVQYNVHKEAIKLYKSNKTMKKEMKPIDHIKINRRVEYKSGSMRIIMMNEDNKLYFIGNINTKGCIFNYNDNLQHKFGNGSNDIVKIYEPPMGCKNLLKPNKHGDIIWERKEEFKVTYDNAKDLCIEAWQIRVDNPCSYESILTEHPVIRKLKSRCAYCELYASDGCKDCPLNLNGIKCSLGIKTNNNHPYHKWYHENNTKNAQFMLDVIKTDGKAYYDSIKEEYITPKTDKNRIFDFIPCEVKDTNSEWKSGFKLYAYIESTDFSFRVTDEDDDKDCYKHCRIIPFSSDNLPPVDTLVQVWNDEDDKDELIIRYFKEYDKNGNLINYDSGKTSKTIRDHSCSIWDHHSFIGFDESLFEVLKEDTKK